MNFEPPAMDYWKVKPKDRLIDDRLTALSGDALKAWYWLRNRARTASPPGILQCTEEQLQRWSLLSKKEWTRVRDQVLQLFDVDDRGHFHDAELKAEWRAWCLQEFERSKSGKLAIQARYKKQKITANVVFPVFVEPYADFPLHPNTPVHERRAKNGDSESGIQPYTPEHSGTRPNTKLVSNQLTNGGDGPPPAYGAASAPSSPKPPPPLRLSPEEFRARQEQQRRLLDSLQQQSPAADAAGVNDPPEPGETHEPPVCTPET